MTRGINRQAVFIKDTGSPYFEEAIFIVSKNADLSDMSSKDMAEEARKIVNNYIKKYSAKSSVSKKLTYMIIGTAIVLCSAVIALLLLLFS